MAMYDEIGELLTGGSNLGALAGFLGENDNAARSAVGASVPILLGGMAKRTRSADGAKAMFDLVSDDDGSMLDNIGSFLSAGDSGGLGSNLVSSMLGSRRSAVEEGLASSTGLGLGTITRFLPMMAPMVMSFLGKKSRSESMDQKGLANLLGGERKAMEQGGLGGLLGLLDGDDDAADDAGFVSGITRMLGLGGLGALGGGAAAAGISGAAAGGMGDKISGGVSGIAGRVTGSADADLPDVDIAGRVTGSADADLPDVDAAAGDVDADLTVDGKGMGGKLAGGAAAAAAGVGGLAAAGSGKLGDLAGTASDAVTGDGDVDLPDVDAAAGDVDADVTVDGKGMGGKLAGGAAAAAAGVGGLAAAGSGKLGDLAGKASDAVTPDVDLAGVKAPDVDLPGAVTPDVDLAGVKAPDVDLPGAATPDVDLPGAKAPDLADVDAPDVDLDGKGISKGKLVGGAAVAGAAGLAASGKLGDLAGKAGDVDLPGVKTPDVNIKKPKVTKPDVNMKKPKVTKPAVDINKPKVTKPDVDIKKPNVSKPDVNARKPAVTGRTASLKGASGDGGAAIGRGVGGGGGFGWLKWLLPLLLILALIAFLIWACSGNNDADTATAPAATPTAVPATATAAPEPTDVPPTATAIPPTATAVPEPTAAPAPTATTAPEPTPVPDPATCAQLVDVATDAGLTTLLTAVQAAGAAEMLTTSGPLTIFAPTDAAFAALPADVTSAALADADLLNQILTYHVVSGAVTSGDIETGAVGTLAGGNVYLRANDNGVSVNSASVVTADVEAGECVVHVVDGVLIPPALLSTVGGTLNDAVGGDTIRFNPGTATLTNGSVDTLNGICAYLGGQPIDVAIGGISVASNTDRAQERSDTVRDYLIECGLSTGQVEALIVSINDADGANLNLLVEFTG